MARTAHQLHPPGEPPGESPRTHGDSSGFPAEREDLPYKVEVWDETGEVVELLVATSKSPAIGYAAYFAATREYPGRAVTLRHRSTVISRWSGKTH